MISRGFLKLSVSTRSYSIISRLQKSGRQLHALEDHTEPLEFPEKVNHVTSQAREVPYMSSVPKKSNSNLPQRKDRSKRVTEKTPPSLPFGLQPVGWELKLPKTYREFQQPEEPKSLKVAFLGPANAGKSTLLNFLVRDEVSAVSPRPQTTRKRTQGIMTVKDTQVIFLDSPGVTTSIINDPGSSRHGHHARSGKLKFDREIINAPWRCLDESDHLVVLLDASKCLSSTTYAEDYIFERLSKEKCTLPATLVFNKVDLIPSISDLGPIVKQFKALYHHFAEEPLYISAANGEGVLDLQQKLLDLAPSRPWCYPANVTSDLSDYDRVVETIRAAYLPHLHSYLPYIFQQSNRGWLENPDGSLHIYQDILVLRPQHEKILVGAGGKVINAVVQEATINLRRQFARKVKIYLQIQVVDRFPPTS